jgi:DNA-binding XRE family transcriptional regulator
MEDPTERVLLPFPAVPAAATPRPGVDAVQDDEMRDMLAFYGRVGLDRRAVAGVTRLAVAVHSSDTDLVAVQRLDLRRLLLWLDQTARTREREIPTLALSDEQYDRVVGRHIRDVRRARGLTHADLGEALGVGPTRVSGIERAQPRASLRLVRRIAAALGVPIGSLVTEWEVSDDQPPRRPGNPRPATGGIETDGT